MPQNVPILKSFFKINEKSRDKEFQNTDYQQDTNKISYTPLG